MNIDLFLKEIWIDSLKKEKLPLVIKFNVILGHSWYEMGEELYKRTEQIARVFYAFSINYSQYDLVKYRAIEEAERYVRLCNSLADNRSVKNLLAF